MLKRTITAVVALAVFLPILYFSDTIVFPAAMALLSLIASYEMVSCMGLKNRLVLAVPSYLTGILLPLLPALMETPLPAIFAVCVMDLIFVFAAVVFSREKMDFTLAASAFTGVFYVAISFASIVLLRGVGKYLYLLVFIGPWVSDTFAYLCGRMFGRHKLIPEVSPKKTVEGSIGGIVFASLSYAVYAWVIVRWFDPTASPNYPVMLLAGAVASVVSQIGDLSASVVKRRFGIKDYGWIFPGHGGVMDRFDSVLLTAPVMYLLSQLPSFADLLI